MLFCTSWILFHMCVNCTLSICTSCKKAPFPFKLSDSYVVEKSEQFQTFTHNPCDDTQMCALQLSWNNAQSAFSRFVNQAHFGYRVCIPLKPLTGRSQKGRWATITRQSCHNPDTDVPVQLSAWPRSCHLRFSNVSLLSNRKKRKQ